MIYRHFALPLLALAATSAAAQESPTTVYVNAVVFTAKTDDKPATAFAVKDGAFVAVGDRKDVAKLIKKKAKVVDLKGQFVMPGLADDHFHGEGGGTGVDLSQVRSMAELIAALRTAAGASGGQLVVSNADWHEAQLKEQRLPTVAELDAASADVPIVVLRGGHSAFLNTAALRKFGITAQTVAPKGGTISLDDKGQLTGELVDAAKRLITLPPPPPTTRATLMKTQTTMNAYGVTSVRIPGALMPGALPTAYKLAHEMKAEGALTLRYTMLLPGPNFGPPGQEGTLKQGDGDDWVRIDGRKLAVDGGFEGANMSDPYAEPYGKNGSYSGLQLVPPASFTEIVRKLNREGWTIATHAAGDAAIDQVLDAYEAADKDVPLAGRRFAIEHAFIVRPEQIERMKKLGVAASLQDHAYLAAPSMIKYWGRERSERVTPVKTFLESGLIVAGGTDAPVVPPNPYWAIYNFITRDTISAGVVGTEERATNRADVLRMFTLNYAKLTGTDKVLGSIEPGKRADFVIVSDDLLKAPVTAIRDARALATYVDGREVYRAANDN